MPAPQKRSRRGGAMLELTFIAPWAFFLFIGALDWGFYSYALISMQAATRSAAHAVRKTDPPSATEACNVVKAEMKNLPNIDQASACAASPLTVTAAKVTGPDGENAAQVSVTYQSITLIPLPGLLKEKFVITRVATMRMK